MVNLTDTQLIEIVDTSLRDGQQWKEIARRLDTPVTTLCSRVNRLGYEVRRYLVPIHAPMLDDQAV